MWSGAVTLPGSCGPAASVRVLPALHSCPFAAGDFDSAAECFGDPGVSAQDRWSKVQGIFADGFPRGAAPVADAGVLGPLHAGAGRDPAPRESVLLPPRPPNARAAALIEARKPGSYFTLEYAADRPLFA
jgi:hypothetical protein